jgi:hypothetical protein
MQLVAILFIACCAGYLYRPARYRMRDYPPERQWPGHGINVTPLSHRVEGVRSDYESERQRKLHATPRRPGLLPSVRRVVSRMPYLQRQAVEGQVSTEPETEPTDATA